MVNTRFLTSTWTTRLGVIIAAAAAIVIGIMQYGWFSSSARSEINQAWQSLSERIYQTFSRETMRLSPLVSELRLVRQGNNSTQARLEEHIKALESSYGSNGPGGNLVSWIAISDTTSSNPAWQVITTNKPVAGSSLPLPSPDSKIIHELDNGNALILVPQSQDQRLVPPVYLLASADQDNRHLLLMELDTQGFFESWILPGLNRELEAYSFSWNFIKRSPPDPNAQDYQGDWRFNPLLLLPGIGAQIIQEPEISIPWFIEMPIPFKDMQTSPPAEPSGEPFNPLAPSVPPPPKPSGIAPNEHEHQRSPWIRMFSYPDLEPYRPHTSVGIRIRVDQGTPLADIEYRLALNWFFSSLLLVVLAASFILLMFQFRRKQEQIQKEREFVAAITHELRTPLTVIVSAADNIIDGIVPQDRVKQYGSLIKEQGNRLSHMLESIMLLSRFEGRSFSAPPPRDCSTTDFFDQLKAKTAVLAVPDVHLITWDYAALMPVFCAERDTLAFVLENLVRNALTHGMPVDAPTQSLIRVSITAKPGIPDCLIFMVEDTGRGIPHHEQKQLGTPFYRGHISKSYHEQGTGLGHYLIKQKLAAINGVIQVESPYTHPDGTRQSGCRFTVRIPGAVKKHE